MSEWLDLKEVESKNLGQEQRCKQPRRKSEDGKVGVCVRVDEEEESEVEV